MNEKIKSFTGFLNESSNQLPSLEEIRSLPGFKEFKEVFPEIILRGGGKDHIQIGVPGNYDVKFTKAGTIYYGGYIIGKFETIDNEKLEFVKDYSISKALSLSLPSLESMISGKTPLRDKNIKEWSDSRFGRSGKIEVFKKGILKRIKDFSTIIKYYKNNPLDKSYLIIPEVKKIVEEGIEKSPRKEIKEGDLSLEQKNYLKNLIRRNPHSSYGLELAGKPKYKLDKETGLVDVYGDFDEGYYTTPAEGVKNFMGIKFGKIYGHFRVNSEKHLPEKNLSGFPVEIDNYFELTDNGSIKSLEGFPDVKGAKIIITGTSVYDFSPVGKIDLTNKYLDLRRNGIKSLTQIKFQDGIKELKELNISANPIKDLKGCPEKIQKLYADYTSIEDLNEGPKESLFISITSVILKDISGLLKIKNLSDFWFASTSDIPIKIKLPITDDSIQKIVTVLKSEYHTDRDKGLLLSLLKREMMYDYFKENPLQIYLLDDFPDIKKEVIDGAGIQDFSKLGKVIGKGWIR